MFFILSLEDGFLTVLVLFNWTGIVCDSFKDPFSVETVLKNADETESFEMDEHDTEDFFGLGKTLFDTLFFFILENTAFQLCVLRIFAPLFYIISFQESFIMKFFI